MKKVVIIILIGLGCFSINNAIAQSKKPIHLSLNYSANMPVAGLHDYVSDISPRGWRATAQVDLDQHWALGLSAGFADYYQKFPREIYKNNNSEISAVQSHTLQTVPILATGVYHFAKADSKVKPYISLGAGVSDVNYENYYGEFADSYNTWHFTLSPAAGVDIPLGKFQKWGINAAVHYNYTPYNHNGINNIQSAEADAGLYFNLR